MSEQPTVSILFDTARAMTADVSMLSWNGFNVVGDKKTIAEVSRLMYAESRLMALELRLEQERKKA